MAISYPTSLDNFTNPTSTDTMDSVTVPHATQHANINDAVEALEAKVGVDGSAVVTSLDYKVSTINTNYITKTLFDNKGDLIVASAADTPALLAASSNNGYVLTVDTTTATGMKWASAGGTSGDDANLIIGFGCFL
jgi:hypothetical protein